MKIWVVFLLCASSFGLPVNDRIVSPEELLQRVLAAHPLENHIELNKRKDESPLPKDWASLLTLGNKQENASNSGGEEETVEKEIQSEVLEEEITTETEVPQEVFISTVVPEVSDVTKKPATESVEAESITVDPQGNIDEDKPNYEEQYSVKAVVEEQELNSKDLRITTEKFVEENETIPDEAFMHEDNSTLKELTQNSEVTESLQDSLLISTTEKTDDESTRGDNPKTDKSTTNDPHEKTIQSGVEKVKPESYQDETELTDLFETTETIPESLSLENNPFLLPEDTLLNEPGLFAGIQMEESPSDASTQDNSFNKNLDKTKQTIVESHGDSLSINIDNPPLAAEISPDPEIQQNFDPHFEEEGPLAFVEDEIKLLPEEFKTVESPGLVSAINPTPNPQKETPYDSQPKESFPLIEEGDLLENPSSRDEPDAGNFEEPTLEKAQISKSELDSGLFMDTVLENTSGVKNLTESKSNNKSNQEILRGRVGTNDGQILKENSNVLSSSVSGMDEDIGHDGRLMNQEVELEVPTPIYFSENPEPITDEPNFDINPNVEGLEHIPVELMDSFSDGIFEDSQLIGEFTTQETLDNEPIPHMDAISNGNLDASIFPQEPLIHDALDQYPLTESDPFFTETQPDLPLTHEIMPEELGIDSVGIADEITDQIPEELEFDQYPMIPDQLGDQGNTFMDEGTSLITPESISDSTYIEESSGLNHYESDFTHEIMPEQLDVGSEMNADEFSNLTPEELEFNQYHSAPDRLGDEASIFVDEETVPFIPESMSDSPLIEENPDLSHYESDFIHEMMPEQLEVESDMIAEELGDETSTFVGEDTVPFIPESMSDSHIIEENPDLSHYDSDFIHEAVPGQLEPESDAIAEEFPLQTPDELESKQYHAIPEPLDVEANPFRTEGAVLVNPETIPDNPYMEENYELSQEPVSFNENFNIEPHVQDLPIVETQELPYENRENLEFDMNEGMPIPELKHSFSHSPQEESNGEHFNHQLRRVTENYPVPYVPMENDSGNHPLVEEDLDNWSNRDYVTEETTEETVTPNTNILEISGDESLSLRDIDSTDGQFEANDQGKTPVKTSDERKITYVMKKPRLDVPFSESLNEYYPYSLISQDYQPFYIPYSTERKFLGESQKPTDYKSLIIILNPTDSRFRSDSNIPSRSNSRPELEFYPHVESRSDSRVPSEATDEDETSLQDKHNNTTMNREVEEKAKDSVENTSDLPPKTTIQPELAQTSTQQDLSLPASTESELAVETSTHLNSPLKQSSQPDSVVKTTTQPELPPKTASQPDLPPITTVLPHLPPKTSTEPNLQPTTSFQTNLPPKKSTQSDLAVETPAQPELNPGTDFKLDLPSKTSFQPNLPPKSSFQPNLPPKSSFQPNLPPKSSFQPNLPPKSSFQPDTPLKTSFQPDLPPITSFQPDLEIPYPSKDQDFYSGPKNRPRKPFTWYPITRQQQQTSNFGESQPVFSKEFDYIFVQPYQNTFKDFSPLTGNNYRLEYSSPYYQISGDTQADNDYEILPYYERDQSYNTVPEDLYNGFYY